MECFICGKKGHKMYQCDEVTPKDRERHIADQKKNFMSKVSAAKKSGSKVGTQHTAVEADDDDDSVATINLGADGKPTYELFLKECGFNGMNLAGEVVGEVAADDESVASASSKQSYADALRGHQYDIDMFNGGSEEPKAKERLRLSEHKLFLDSCATYHSVFVEWCLKNVHEVKRYLKGHCNAGVTICKEQGYYGAFKMWLNRNGIANLLSIPQLERDGYTVDYNTKRNWVVTTPEGKEIVFKRDTGLCDRMPYIDLRDNDDGVIM